MAENRERDLVLAPNEFAFISDQTKGNIIAYVGPYKTSMANTDKPVYFNKKTKIFEICELDKSIQTFTACPEGWYIILKNPAVDAKPPQIGTSNQLVTLNIGRKVNIPGPAFFALWPGQMAEVIEGHFLRSNEYLMVRVYEERQARENWGNAVITPQLTNSEGLDDNGNLDIDTIDATKLTMGQLLIIKGTDVSFYIPPTGVEVVKDEKSGEFVRKAVTLERLEYCILLDESGNKRYIQGPAVVFPSPTERFVEKNGSRKFKAIELNENSGIYVKIIAPYEENEKQYKVGDELFITGKEQMIYFPRPEHAMIKYGDQDIYYAVAIPPGEGRYYLNRNTGKIALKQGPCMFLPDPREEVIVRRILSPKQTRLWFPGNEEAVQYNLKLQELSDIQQEIMSQKGEDMKLSGMAQPSQALLDVNLLKEDAEEKVFEGIVGNSFSRKTSFSKPRTITLNNKYEGAVTIDVWTGYAILVTSKTGERKVVVGPATHLLQYDEVLQPIELSTGTPKNDDKLLNTVYLRSLNNKVSDVVRAETKDFCNVDIRMSYRVNFTGEPEKWFNVENYVKFLTDHLRSVVRNALKQFNVSDFYANGISIMRDIILGPKKEEEKSRPGWLFPENGMHVYEVEVLDIEIQDEEIQELLFEAKHEEIRKNLDLSSKERELTYTVKSEQISRDISGTRSLTKKYGLDLEKEENAKQLELNLSKLEAELKIQQEELAALFDEQSRQLEINRLKLAKDKETQELQLIISERLMEQRLRELQAQVDAVVSKAEAISPDLIAALQAFGDKALAEKMAETMAPLSIIGGKSIVEVFANLLQGTQLEKVLRLNVEKGE
jgi:major vault protein